VLVWRRLHGLLQMLHWLLLLLQVETNMTPAAARHQQQQEGRLLIHSC
jgi:hypothetical protein